MLTEQIDFFCGAHFYCVVERISSENVIAKMTRRTTCSSKNEHRDGRPQTNDDANDKDEDRSFKLFLWNFAENTFIILLSRMPRQRVTINFRKHYRSNLIRPAEKTIRT